MATNEQTFKLNCDPSDFKKKIHSAISAVKKFKEETKSMGSGAKSSQSAFENLTRSLKKISSASKRTASSTKSLSKSIKSTKDPMEQFAKQLTRIGKMLRLMVLRTFLRKVIEEVGNGFKGLAKYCKEFDNTMSLLVNSSKQLSYSFSAMVAPLLNALAPALNYIIQLCIKVINVINQLFSALSGKSTYITAKEQTGSWADSLDKANGSAKKLKRTLLGFDEINKLDDENDKSGGSDTLDPDSMFETKDIESKFKTLANKIKDIFNKLLEPLKKAWDKMGKYVVQAWTKAFNSVKKLAKDVFNDFLEVWNQDATVKIFEDILAIIADIGYAVSGLADAFDNAWNKNKTGKKILEDVRDIIGIVVSHAKEMANQFVQFTYRLDFSPLFEAVERFLESIKPVVDNIMGVIEDLWKDAILPFAEWLTEVGIPNLIQVFTDFNNKVDWENIRKQLDKVWKALEPFAETVFTGITQVISDISNAVADFANSDNFEKFVDTIVDWMNSVDSDEVANAIKLIAGAIITLKASLFAFSGISKAVELLATFAGIASTLAGMAVVTSMVVITIKGIEDAKHWIDMVKEHGWEKGRVLVREEKIKISPYERSEEDVTDWLNGINQKWVEHCNSVYEINRKHHEDMKQAHSNYCKEIYEKNRQHHEELKNNLSTFLQETLSKWKTNREELKKEHEQRKKDLSDKLDGMKSDVKNWFSNHIKPMFSKETWTFSGIKNGLKESFDNALEGVKSLWNNWANKVNGQSFTIGSHSISFHIPTFSTGGFPEDGLFMANHGEMVGRFSNGKTAVANNEQITTGIAQAVYQAMMSANSNGGGSYINNTIQIDGETIARAVTQGQNKLNRRYSPTMA